MDGDVRAPILFVGNKYALHVQALTLSQGDSGW